VKIYFDTSALIAAMIEEEGHHQAALKALSDCEQGFTASHTLAEVFSTLTGGRLEVQLSPKEAGQIVEANVIQRLQILNLTVDDYKLAMQNSESVGARGGAVYDMLHLQAARRGKANRILTINVRHFQIFAPDLRDRITLP
jgi:predicted nucleic acid-binding protein